MAQYYYKLTDEKGFYPPEADCKEQKDGTYLITLQQNSVDDKGNAVYTAYAQYSVDASGKGKDMASGKEIDLTLYSKVYSPEELCKLAQNYYYKINDLLDLIRDASEWAPIEKTFQDKKCIRLALQNYGKAFDEDVEVSMSFPADCVESIYNVAQFDNDQMEYLLSKCDIGELFGIRSTADYLDYSASRPDAGKPIPMPMPMHGPISTYYQAPDYSEAFFSTLENTFCYSVYQKEPHCIVKLKFNYIKHNTTVAFPSVIFLKNKLLDIPYKITSKNNPDVIEGTLIVKS